MNKINLNIWGRDFELGIEYDYYTGEEILPIQKEALKSFVSDRESISSAKCVVEKYCLSNNPEEYGTDHIDNIFKYIIPKYLYVKRNEKKRVIALMCDYKFDMEHGIAIVFENEKLTKIGKQDIIL